VQVVSYSLRLGCDFLAKPPLHYQLKACVFVQENRMIGQQRRHYWADDFGWEGSILRAETRLIKQRLEGSFGPSLQMSS
jgi:hypothetical protein